MKFSLVVLAVSVAIVSVFAAEDQDGKLSLPQGLKEEDLKVTPLFSAMSEKDSVKTVKSAVNGNMKTARYPGRYLRGAFMLCEGYTPGTWLYRSYDSRVQYDVVTSHTCSVHPIYASLRTSAQYLNHASLWARGEFTGLDEIKEWGVACPSHSGSFVGIRRTINGVKSIIARCTTGYEAHVFAFKI